MAASRSSRCAMPSLPAAIRRSATVIEADLWRLGQAPIGSRVRFIETTWDEALEAAAGNERWLDEAVRLIGLYRTRSANL